MKSLLSAIRPKDDGYERLIDTPSLMEPLSEKAPGGMQPWTTREPTATYPDWGFGAALPTMSDFEKLRGEARASSPFNENDPIDNAICDSQLLIPGAVSALTAHVVANALSLLAEKHEHNPRLIDGMRKAARRHFEEAWEVSSTLIIRQFV